MQFTNHANQRLLRSLGLRFSGQGLARLDFMFNRANCVLLLVCVFRIGFDQVFDYGQLTLPDHTSILYNKSAVKSSPNTKFLKIFSLHVKMFQLKGQKIKYICVIFIEVSLENFFHLVYNIYCITSEREKTNNSRKHCKAQIFRKSDQTVTGTALKEAQTTGNSRKRAARNDVRSANGAKHGVP